MENKIKSLITWIEGRKIYLFSGISVIVLSALLGFAAKKHQNKLCSGLSVEIVDESAYQFISKKDVQDIVTNHGSQPVSEKNISTIQLRQVENRLMQNSFIKDAQAYLSLGSHLHIKVSQRVPIVRVYNEKNEHYYIDNEGKPMPLSPNFTARVPVATATYFSKDNDSVSNSFNAKLYSLAQLIHNDPFLASLCGQIIVDKHYEFSIIPRLGKVEIFLGDTSEMPDKIVKLKSFYKASLPQAGWDKYRSISLKFKNQVVATANIE